MNDAASTAVRPRVRVGPAGWSYPDWDGRVYPAHKPHGFHPLAWLARTFDCVEVNSSFYALPRREHAERWTQVVAERPEFRFFVKLHRSFTHEPEPHDDGATWQTHARAYLEGIEPLRRARKLSAILAQFPISFLHGKSEVRRLGRLRSLFSDQPLVVELRHESWFTPPALATVRGLSLSLAYIDLPAAWNHPPAWHEPTGALGYVRLHGRNATEWFRAGADRDEKYDYLYSRAELEEIAVRVRRVAERHDQTAVVMNNHFSGKAVANGIELLFLLQGAPPAVPAEVVESFPHLSRIARVVGQDRLF